MGSICDRMAFFAAALLTVILRTSCIVTQVFHTVWAPIFLLATWPILAANDIHISRLWYWIIERRTSREECVQAKQP
ncbi:uncharacterized protein EDB91DRAFT_1126938 [Suillus paluster]|uniref:uncharacterized protein n=1 Tax=Suillus paluster TaxID=48578 RepID=UPI001B860248|nr:uncharacterized protein EDB91DRAFT_1126938 [Suillus paluster]KAG1743344.1 hypothetical protein EDB91DRAFT_1126938 [Suillus paluster]